METKPSIETQSEQQVFSAHIKALADKFRPERIYCFGKNSVTVNKNTSFITSFEETQTHYFLLMVTESNTRIEHEVQDYANNILISGSVTVLAHGKQNIAQAILANNKFFNTVYRDAPIVYSRDGILSRQDVAPFIPTQWAGKSRKHYEQRIEMAEGFLHGASECLSAEKLNACVFLLHQVVEQCCIALIRVHLAYRSEIHNLNRLLRLCRCFSDKPANILFQSGSKADERLLDLLVQSYGMARYKNNFLISFEDTSRLFDRIDEFLALSKEMCEQKIQELEEEAKAYKQMNNNDDLCKNIY